MAAPQRLQSANVSPAARPVDTFMSFDANSRPAAPAKPELLPQPKGVALKCLGTYLQFKMPVPIG